MTALALPQVKSPAGLVPTDIEWADFAFNPLRAILRHDIHLKGGRSVPAGTDGARLVKAGKTGWACQKVATGCKNCYAEAINKRFGTGLNYDAEAMKHIEVVLDRQRIIAALHAKPRGPFKAPDGRPKVFVADMTDLLGEFVSDLAVDAVFALADQRRDIDWMMLTKRPERLPPYLARFPGAPLPNVWLGCSVSCQADADANIPHLLRAPAAVRFVSYEPATGPVDVTGIRRCPPEIVLRPLTGRFARIDWLIVGGESGHGARACDVAWLRSAVKQGRDAGVPVFVKQLGSRPRLAEGVDYTVQMRCEGGDSYAHAEPAGFAPRGRTRVEGPIATVEVTTYGVRIDPDGAASLANRKGGDPAEWPEDLRVRQWPRGRFQ